jgi:hypothetical protein
LTIAERKNTKTNIESLNRILYLLDYNKETLLSESPESSFKKASDYVKSIVAKLEDKKDKLPIGHRYTGTFYLKKPYSIPYESVKIKGSAFMREDLVSWTIESDNEYAKNVYYVRDIFKEKGMKTTLKREDGEAVFEVKRDNQQ